ncbi:MAG: hypothetical protein WCY09_10565 [Candidatus Omnitrophota bacterium]|jgi:hypothetical protein
MKKKNQDPKEALKSLLSDARKQASIIEAACVLLENTLNGIDPEKPDDFLDKMSSLSFGRLIVEKIRKALQENYIRTSKVE